MVFSLLQVRGWFLLILGNIPVLIVMFIAFFTSFSCFMDNFDTFYTPAWYELPNEWRNAQKEAEFFVIKIIFFLFCFFIILLGELTAIQRYYPSLFPIINSFPWFI